MDSIELQVMLKGELRIYNVTLEESEEIKEILESEDEVAIEEKLEVLLAGKKIVAFSKTGSFDMIHRLKPLNNTRH